MFQIKGNRKHDKQWQCVILDLGRKNTKMSISDKIRKYRIKNL